MRPTTKGIWRTVAMLGMAAMAFVLTAPAQAAVWDGSEYSVSVKHRAYGVINANKPIRTCDGTKGIECEISVTTTVRRSVQTAFGASVGVVAGKISIGSETSESYTVSCGPWVLPTSSSKLVVYPKGTQVFYTITEKKYVRGRLTDTNTSGTLMAFVPDDNSYFCAKIR